VQPRERAAELLGQCLDDVADHTIDDAAVDEACAGLLALGESGRTQMGQRLGLLSVDRRLWFVGYVQHSGGGDRRAWLEMLRGDADDRVRTAAEEALQSLAQGGGPRTTSEPG
jgi:hypothetical protein